MSRRTDTHARIIADLTHHQPAQVATAIARLMDARPALPGAASTDGTRGRGGTSSVEALALAPDPVAAEIRQLDQVLRRMAVDALWLRGLVDRWTPHAPTQRDLREVERINTPANDCEHHTAAGIYEEATRPSGTVAGNLPHPMRLCEFCWWQVYRKGTLPRADVLDEMHHTGKRPRQRA